MSVKLKTDKLVDGRDSIYLDVYIDQNNFYRKSLKMYLIPEKSVSDKELNKQTWRLAEIVRNEYELDLLNKKLGKYDKRKDYNYSFINYYDKLVALRFESGVNYSTWMSLQKHLHAFTKKKLNFDEINKTWMETFKSFLTKRVSQNSAQSYFNVLKNALHSALEEQLLEYNGAFKVTAPKMVNPVREFLTEDELVKLKDEECRYPVLKKAFFFSVLTGLRWSDIQNLTWKNVVDEKEQSYLVFKVQKTREAERLPIRQDARQLIGERLSSEDRVFIGLKYSAWHNVELTRWMMRAGITKKITFHCARHTHATLLLNKGVDIYTVSKMLGHKEVRTTQIYAKLVNETKVKAVELLPSIL